MVKFNLQFLKEKFCEDFQSTYDDFRLLSIKLKRGVKRLRFYRKWSVGFLIFLILYGVRWMRPANFPVVIPNESLFDLPVESKISSGNNLVYTFVTEEMTTFSKKTEPVWQRGVPGIVGLNYFPKKIKEVRLLQRGFMRNPYSFKNLQDDVLRGGVIDLSLDEYFSALSGEAIQYLQSEFGLVSGVIVDIGNKDWSVEVGDRFEQIIADNNARAYAKVLNFLAGYSCWKGERDLCVQYLKASYLLGVKMSKRNMNIGVSYGLGIREEALLMMLYLHQQGKISLKESGLLSLIKQWQIDAEALTRQTIKMDYQNYKHVFENAYRGENLWKMLVLDEKETLRMMQVLYSFQLDYFPLGVDSFEELGKKMDQRLFDRGMSYGYLYQETGWDCFMYELREIGKVFWRKNILGVEFLGMLSSSVYGQAKIVEDYEWYLLNYLE